MDQRGPVRGRQTTRQQRPNSRAAPFAPMAAATRASPVRLLLPIALAAALFLAGCLTPIDGGEVPPVEDGSNEEPTDAAPREPNAPQSGTNGPCLDFNVLWEYPMVSSPLDPHVEVAPKTAWTASSSDGFVQTAAYGVVCVTIENSYPGVPAPAAEWVYQDGH
jgi:hypothetical protein